MNGYLRTEYVLHDDLVSFLVVDSDAVHAEIMGQQRLAVPLNYVLQGTQTPVNNKVGSWR